MFFTVYKITNLVNGKFYIGKHQTNDLNDEYFGSGKLLRRAIQKYGIENFKKEILEIFDSEWKMNLAEKILVVMDKEVSYNICSGGKGGFGYINTSGIYGFQRRSKAGRLNGLKSTGHREAAIIGYKKNGLSEAFKKARFKSFLGQHHSDETKSKLREKARLRTGSINHRFGMMWVTNGIENKTIKNDNSIPNGYRKGRTL